jgi:dsDNA-specific endonuclease/ATPase MutS2
VQALGGGSPELRPLAEARRGGSADLTDTPTPDRTPPPDPAPQGGGESEDEPVRIPIEDAIDLHAFPPRDVASVVEEYLTAAREHGFREVRLIHGRGIGVQRSIVHALLSRHPLVSSFAEAPPERGGWGATIVRLR